MAEALEFEQLLYGWSESSIFGRRGFGVVAASQGWRALLAGGDDVLGPIGDFPEPGRRGAHPPPCGGFAMLRGKPVVFRRIPLGSDAFDRPGNYTVHVLFGQGFDLDAGLAAALLAGGWLESALPAAAGAVLPVLSLPKPGPRRSNGASGIVCGAVLQALRDSRPLVLQAPGEPVARAALCDALRRLPGGLGSSTTFSTLENQPDRASFDVSVAVEGWAVDGSGRGVLRVDVDSDGALDADCLRWGQALAAATVGSLRGIPEPVTVQAVGMRLDALATLRADPARLTPQQLLSVLASAEGQTWAGEPGAAAVVRRIVAGMDPALGPAFAKTAQRRPAVSALLSEVGWGVLSGGKGSRKAAEAMLLGLGEPQSAIDMAVLASLPGDKLSPEDSARYVRLLAQRGQPVDDKTIAKIAWDANLMRAHPQIWFDAVVGQQRYTGPRATRDVVGALDVAKVGATLDRGHERGQSERMTAERLRRVLPSGRTDRIRFLRLIAASSSAGLGLVFEEILDHPSIEPAVRSALLGEFWPILVQRMKLPAYLGSALQPAGGLRLSQRGRVVLGALAVALVVLAMWGVWTLAR